MSLTVIDSVPLSPSYIITPISSNTALLPTANLHVALETNSGWVLTATAAPNQAGATILNLAIRDNAGVASSAQLTVTVASQSLGAQFNDPSLGWTSWGDAFWFGQTAVTHSGTSAAQSGHVLDLQQSWVGASAVGPGRLLFWWKASSENSFDFLDFYLNGVRQANRLSGERDWQSQVFNVPPGTNNFAWRYSKDQDTFGGLDAGWLDEVKFAAGVWLEIPTAVSNNQVRLVLHGVPGRLYEVQISTNFLNWSRLAPITPTNTSTLLIDTNSGSGSRFYRLHDLQSSILHWNLPVLFATRWTPNLD
jgi:hypothetical protein